MGLEASPELISYGEYTIDNGYDKACILMNLPPERRPDGLICADDLIALGAMHAISGTGLSIPENVGVLGFNDVPYAALPQIQLSTVKIPCKEMGEAGMKLLLDKIHAKDSNQKQISHTLNLKTLLIPRRTTKKKQ